MNPNAIYLRKRPSATDLIEAVTDFMSDWCADCEMGQLLNDPSIDPSTLKIPCPPSVYDTCPIHKLYFSKKEELNNEDVRPEDQNADD